MATPVWRGGAVAVLAIGIAGSVCPPAWARSSGGARLGRTVVVKRVAGVVRIRTPASRRLKRLIGRAVIPVGSIVDVSHGSVRLTSAKNARGATQFGVFDGTAFKVEQRPGSPLTSLTLVGGGLSGCGKASAARSKRRGRRLTGRAHGVFRTVARYTSASVHGTIWVTEDNCQGSRVGVQRGTVVTTDRIGQTQTLSDGTVLNEYCHFDSHPLYCVLTLYTPKQAVAGAPGTYHKAKAGFLAVVGVNAAEAASFKTFDLCLINPAGRQACSTHQFEAKKAATPDFFLLDFSMVCFGSPGPSDYIVRWLTSGGAILGDTPLAFTDAADPINCKILHGA